MATLTLFSRRRRPQSRLVAIDASRHEYTIHFEQGTWWWDHGKGSWPQSAAIENVKAAGGRVERRALGEG